MGIIEKITNATGWAWRAAARRATITIGSGILAVWGLSVAGGCAAQGQNPLPANDPGRKSFESRCGRCHGGDGKGREMGPNIVERLPQYRTDEQLTALIHTGIPQGGMPPNAVERVAQSFASPRNSAAFRRLALTKPLRLSC